MSPTKVIQSFDDLRFDFNQLTDLLSSANFKSRVSGNHLNEFILQASYQILGTHTHIYFKDLIEKMIKKYYLYGVPIDVDLFAGFTQSAASTIHDDPYDVLIYGLYGDTMYIVDKKQYLVKAGDIIRINEGEVHQGIGLSPRIILSLGIRKDKVVENNLKNRSRPEIEV
tara:strand:+ start:44 stop:550 length:507 start_codon:yes stop_codon:yes gene_type:complete